MFDQDHFHEDPSTDRIFAVNATDGTPDEVAEDVAYSPFTGEPLSVGGESSDASED